MPVESMKAVIDRRNKSRHDALSILDRAKEEGRTPTAEELGQSDTLLEKAVTADAELQNRGRAAEIREKLSGGDWDGTEADPVTGMRFGTEPARQTRSSEPGLSPTNHNDGSALAIKYGKKGEKKSLSIQPGTRTHALGSDQYRKDFAGWMMGRRETLAMSVGKSPKGGYLVPPQLLARIIEILDDLCFMRGLSTVLPPMQEGTSLGVLTRETDYADSDWTPEILVADPTPDDGLTLGKRQFMLHAILKYIEISRVLVNNASAVLDIEEYVAARLAYRFAISQEKAFLTGSGVDQPLGVFTASADGIPTTQDVACGSTTTVVYDDFVNTLMFLKGPYQERSTWIVTRALLKITMKLKSATAQPLWGMGLNGGKPTDLLGRPYVISEFAPSTFTTGLYVAALGDWKSCYLIGDSAEPTIEFYDDSPLAKRRLYGYMGTTACDGQPVLGEAATRMKLA